MAVTTIAEAVAAMEAIADQFPATDGVAAFNRMYLEVTRAVGVAVADGVFANSSFLDHLDVVFANRYLSAVAAAERGSADVPRCWAVLWEFRQATDRAPLQFAVAGMNAHINHDLVLALVETFLELGLEPHDPVLMADFDRVNVLLGTLDGPIRRSFEQGLLLRMDQRIGGVENCIDSWSIARAREAAWIDARALWRVREHEHLRLRYERALDEATALAGHALLLPTGGHNHGPDGLCQTQNPLLDSLSV